MDNKTLRRQNVEFAGTYGISNANRRAKFVPAFRDLETDRVEIARLRNGQPATMHLICGLPEEWAVDHDEHGSICRVKPSIVAGFVREGIFYSREQAARISTANH